MKSNMSDIVVSWRPSLQLSKTKSLYWVLGALSLWVLWTHVTGPTTRNWPPTDPKRPSKSYWKMHYRKDTITKNTQLFRRLLFICSHDILINLGVFEKQKKSRWHMSYSVLGGVLGCRPPSTTHCRQERLYRLKKSSFYFVVESGQA